MLIARCLGIVDACCIRRGAAGCSEQTGVPTRTAIVGGAGRLIAFGRLDDGTPPSV